MKKNDPDSRPEREAGDDPNGVGRWDVSAAAVRTPEAERPKHWPTGYQQPNATPAQIEFARNWRDTPTELIDEYTIVTHLVLVGGGTPFFTALDSWINLNLVETRTFPAEWS